MHSLTYGLEYFLNMFSTAFMARVKYKDINPQNTPNNIT